MTMETWLAFAAASTVLLLIPGPTILLVLSLALSGGKQTALRAAAGVATGDLIAMTASLAGLGALIAASASLFVALKWIGAAYLVFLGLRLILPTLRRDPNGAAETLPISKPQKPFRDAALVTALNPKSIAFFVAFVPQFLAPAQPLLPQFAILITTFVSLATLNALAYAYLAGALRARLLRPIWQRWLTRAGGVMLITMGALTAGLKRAA